MQHGFEHTASSLHIHVALVEIIHIVPGDFFACRLTDYRLL